MPFEENQYSSGQKNTPKDIAAKMVQSVALI